MMSWMILMEELTMIMRKTEIHPKVDTQTAVYKHCIVAELA
jgi:hypothetical protein